MRWHRCGWPWASLSSWSWCVTFPAPHFHFTLILVQCQECIHSRILWTCTGCKNTFSNYLQFSFQFQVSSPLHQNAPLRSPRSWPQLPRRILRASQIRLHGRRQDKMAQYVNQESRSPCHIRKIDRLPRNREAPWRRRQSTYEGGLCSISSCIYPIPPSCQVGELVILHDVDRLKMASMFCKACHQPTQNALPSPSN